MIAAGPVVDAARIRTVFEKLVPERNRLLMQIYADVTGRTFRVAASAQTPALGSAMFAAVAAGPESGGYASIADATAQMAHLRADAYEPIAANRETYDILYGEYVRLHDLFGRGGDPAVKTLKRLRLQAAASQGYGARSAT